MTVLTGKTKDACEAKKKKEFIHYFLSAGRCPAMSRQAGLHHT